MGTRSQAAAAQAPAIEAAGGVLWRPAPFGEELGAVEVALVHRPKYDDWSIPKGKLHGGEHPLLAAGREVEEETGFTATLGRPLGEIRYDKDGSAKRVRYWSMPVTGDGDFTANAEVDEVRWLSPRRAVPLLSPRRDRGIMSDFADLARHGGLRTRPLVIVRHASAGDSAAWPGDDADRPLDGTGERQAVVLADVLAAFGVERVYSADLLRCIDTVRPYATASGIAIESEPLVSERGFSGHDDLAVARLVEIAQEPGAAVVCTQRKAMGGLLRGLGARLGEDTRGITHTPKGGFRVCHLAGAADTTRIAVWEPFTV